MAKKAEQPTVFILYVPGGAMHGLIPAMTLSRIEELTETPVPELFQVVEGVSTGSILAAGFSSIEGMTAKRGAELFAELGPTFFPYMPGRWARMTTSQGLNIGKNIFGFDPREKDAIAIKDIKRLCAKMRARNQTADLPLLYEIEALATERWLTTGKQKQILALGEKISEQDPGLKKHTEAVSELLTTRTFTGRLSIAFKSAASGIIDKFIEWRMPEEKCLFDSKVAENAYKRIFGDSRISDTVCSLYISAFDIINNRVVTFSSLKDDIFDNQRSSSSARNNDIKIWDAILASTANEFAWKAHITEDNLLCTDKAPFHKPRSVEDVLAKVPDDTKVVLVIAGTGKHFSNELIEFIEHDDCEEDGLTEKERYRQKLEQIRDRRAKTGVPGSLILGNEIQEVEAYTMSDALEDFGKRIGEENIYEFSPRMTPHTPEEEATFPAHDALDASEDNIKKIIGRAQDLIKDEKEDQNLRELSQMLVDNLYLLGRMDQEKYDRVSARIGIKGLVNYTTDKTAREIAERITPNDKATGLRRIWHRITRYFDDNNNGGPPVTPRHKGPNGPS